MASAQIIDGKSVAAALRQQLAAHTAQLKRDHNLVPGLAVVLVGEDPASQIYVRSKHKATQEIGMRGFEYILPVTTSQQELLTLIDRLNKDPEVHGILVQLPLPPQIDPKEVINAIEPSKDVDGFHVVNVGRLSTGMSAMIPCTPKGCLHLLKMVQPKLGGMHAIVIGRSNIVGKPMAQLLLTENCTVVQTHSHTRNLAEECRRADIVIAAIGKPEFVRGDWIKEGVLVIDVGINRIADASTKTGSRVVGDVNFSEAVQHAGAITPVPGGVGPMTIASLLSNTIKAACWQAGVERPLFTPLERKYIIAQTASG